MWKSNVLDKVLNKTHTVLVLTVCWVALQIWSFWVSSSIDGPRNIDTGFKRLDVFFKWQVLAFCLALGSAFFVLFSKGLQMRSRFIGLSPAILTIVCVGGIFLFALLGLGETTQSEIDKPVAAPAAKVD